MAVQHTVSLEDARAFLRQKYGDAGDVAEAGRGEWSIAYAFRHAGAPYVVRFGREREDFEKDAYAARFAAPALPIPRVVEIGDAFGAHYAISEFAPGGFLDDLDAAGMRATLPSLFAAFDAMRAADVSASSGYGMWGREGNAPHATWRDALLASCDGPGPRISGWRAKLDASRDAAATFDAAYACVRDLAPHCPEARHVLHNDTLHRNILVQENRVTGIIDWGCAAFGDFVYEVAYMAFWWPWYTQWREIDLVAEARRHYDAIGLAVPDFAERVRCYQLLTALDALTYTAWLDRHDEIAWIVERTRPLIAHH